MITKWYNPKTKEIEKFFRKYDKNGPLYQDIRVLFSKLYTKEELKNDLKLEEL